MNAFYYSAKKNTDGWITRVRGSMNNHISARTYREENPETENPTEFSTVRMNTVSLSAVLSPACPFSPTSPLQWLPSISSFPVTPADQPSNLQTW